MFNISSNKRNANLNYPDSISPQESRIQATIGVGEDVGEKHTHTLLVGLQISAPTLESSMEILQKVGLEAPFDPAIPILGLYSKDLKSAYYRDTATSMFIAAQFTIARLWNQRRCPSVDEWIKKLWHVYTMECYSAMKNDKIMAFAGKWMKLEDIMVSEISQSQKTKGQMISLISG